MSDNRSYVGAPYNFVPFSESVIDAYTSASALPKHNEYVKDRMSGRIRYTLQALTPIFVGDGKRFYRGLDGKEAIPGSSLRGMIRSNMTILGGASMGSDIADNRFMYRDIEHDYYRKVLGDQAKDGISVITNVQAGYIKNENGTYYIYPNVEGKFYTVSERRVLEGPNKMNFRDFFDKFQYQEDAVFEEKPSDDGKKHYGSDDKNPNYMPYSEMCDFKTDILYQLDDAGNVIGLRRVPKGKEKNPKYKKGSVVSSGYIMEKKVFYVIPALSTEKPIRIPKQSIDTFNRDFQMRKNILGRKREAYYSLPKRGQVRPVFYIQYNDNLYFGYTPRLRLFYDKRVSDGIPSPHKEAKIDYVKAMFGYTENNAITRKVESYKSRLSFGDAKVRGYAKYGEEIPMAQGEPKPTSYMDYLYQENYNEREGNFGYNGDFTLRGVKQYWGHKDVANVVTSSNPKYNNEIAPLKKGTTFEGVIRFENLTEVELGLLLWSVALEENCWQNIGKAKAYGLGRVNVNIESLEVLDTGKMYQSENLCWDVYQDKTAEVSSYVQVAKDDLGTAKWPSVMDFLAMKKVILPDSQTRYMRIQKKEYQKRKTERIPLGNVQQVIRGEEPKSLKR